VVILTAVTADFSTVLKLWIAARNDSDIFALVLDRRRDILVDDLHIDRPFSLLTSTVGTPLGISPMAS
jgi:hypothetical protein